MMDQNNKALLLDYINEIQTKKAKIQAMRQPIFEPGLQEYLEYWDANMNEVTNRVSLCVEVQGTRYEQRSQLLESMQASSSITISRDAYNSYNEANFLVLAQNQQDLGSLPAALCNALAPLYDDGIAQVLSVSIAHLERLSVRSRNAKKSVLFINLEIQLHDL